jgi:SSS family solute:Na+ symporter
MEGFNRGPSAIVIAVIACGAALVVGKIGFVIRRLRRLELMTIPEYYERRFGRSARVLGGSICALAGILNMGLYPKMGAVFLAHATGLAGDENAATTIHWIMTALIVLVVVYTVVGGMVAVILTDYLQFIVVSIGLAIGCGSVPAVPSRWAWWAWSP